LKVGRGWKGLPWRVGGGTMEGGKKSTVWRPLNFLNKEGGGRIQPSLFF